MLRFLPFLFIPFYLLVANIDSTITEKRNLLEKKETQEGMLGKKISQIAKDILREQKELDSVTIEIGEIEIKIEDTKNEYEEKNKKLAEVTNEQNLLLNKKKDIEQRVVEILAKELSFAIIRNNSSPLYVDDLITEEVVGQISSLSKTDIETLKDEHNKVTAQIGVIKDEMKHLQEFIKTQENKRKKLLALKEKSQKMITSLDEKKESYRKELVSIEKEKNELRDILKQLRVVQEEERKKEDEKKEVAKNEDVEEVLEIKKNENGDEVIDVKQVATSYQKLSTTKYTGAKTIAPLDEFEVEQKFGPYYDPVYKLKVFNESVILNPKNSGAKVKSVLDGKVIFAKDTPVLNKVVIVEHPGSLHTVYANLSAIAPTIKQGVSIKKGYVLGRVDNKLTFEVTKKNTHIDPLELIALN